MSSSSHEYEDDSTMRSREVNSPQVEDEEEEEVEENSQNTEDDEMEEEVEENSQDTNDDETIRNANESANTQILEATPDLPALESSHLREIGHEAVWSLSSAKPGNGVLQIRDQSLDTYWQSDGGNPHLINIQFTRKAAVCQVAFYMDYSLDESYTPKQLSVRVGMTFHDLVEVKVVDVHEPVGWVTIPLYRVPGDDPLDDEEELNRIENEEDEEGKDDDDKNPQNKKKSIRTHFVQICVVSMHQNGRDAHIRQVKMFGPRRGGELAVQQCNDSSWDCGVPKFQTVEMSQFSTIR